jgi:hypothetical protein
MFAKGQIEIIRNYLRPPTLQLVIISISRPLNLQLGTVPTPRPLTLQLVTLPTSRPLTLQLVNLPKYHYPDFSLLNPTQNIFTILYSTSRRSLGEMM